MDYNTQRKVPPNRDDVYYERNRGGYYGNYQDRGSYGRGEYDRGRMRHSTGGISNGFNRSNNFDGFQSSNYYDRPVMTNNYRKDFSYSNGSAPRYGSPRWNSYKDPNYNNYRRDYYDQPGSRYEYDDKKYYDNGYKPDRSRSSSTDKFRSESPHEKGYYNAPNITKDYLNPMSSSRKYYKPTNRGSYDTPRNASYDPYKTEPQASSTDTDDSDHKSDIKNEEPESNVIARSLIDKDNEINDIKKELESVIRQSEGLYEFPPALTETNSLTLEYTPKSRDDNMVFNQSIVHKILLKNRHRAKSSVDDLRCLYPREVSNTVPNVKENIPSNHPVFIKNEEDNKKIRSAMCKVVASRKLESRTIFQKVQQTRSTHLDSWRNYLYQIKEDQLIEEISGRPNTRSRKEQKRKDKLDENDRFYDSLAEIPDMILDPYERRVRFLDTNGFIRDEKEKIDYLSTSTIWLEEEERLFFKLYKKYHKDFDKIASRLPNKDRKKCIEFYYKNVELLRPYFRS
eukprot:TRINITY_DN6004_c0_g1_i2.p1 TRINITY_DN6004_c0_g1~~TRINITY_DN6004_c0_g1_i2.p1  ORF type:complete len:511 (-),score=92.92 TRINITY_DN6004_c0_g1_i2:16-1548(-)